MLVLEGQWVGSNCSYYKASSYFQVLRPPHLAGELHNFWWTKEAPTWLDVEVQVDRTSKYLNMFTTASVWNIIMKHSSFCTDCLGRSSPFFCLRVEGLQIINCRYHPWCAPIVSEKDFFFFWNLLSGTGETQRDIWILVLEGNGGMEHLAAPGYWVNCFQRPLYFHAENPKVLGAVVEVWPFRCSWAFWKLADHLQEALCPVLKLHTRVPVY